MKKLNDLFSSWLAGTDGIFYFLQNLTDINVPWKAENISAILDLQYHGNNSGEKWVSPLVDKMISNNVLSDENKSKLASVIWTMYGKQWTRLYNLLSVQYNPIENYSMTETHTGTETDLQTPNNWKSTETQTPNNWKNTETQTPTNWKNTETQTPTDWSTTNESLLADNENNSSSSIYAVNSSTAVPVTETTTTAKTKNTTTQAGTFETETEQSGTYETEREQSGTYETEREQSGTYEEKTTYNTTLQRSGNIGVTTSQQMAQSEIDLWKWNYFNTVFADIDKILTLSVY